MPSFSAKVGPLVPDFVDDENSFLPSFAELRRKNLETLYGDRNDKSPKGSVDAAIEDLCTLINSHPSFVTLSSCSGRIALFDPKRIHSDDELEHQRKDGKGIGEWILVSHEPIDASSLIDILSKELSSGTLVFKHEPLLLHVAASSLDRGRQLLSLALQLGFRESGLVVTLARVTVAIRSQALALTVPLTCAGPLRPSDEYLVALAQHANQLLNQNLEKLRRLQMEIKLALFRDIQPNVDVDPRVANKVYTRVFRLPALNLWGHDAVVVPSSEGEGAKIYVFGGYGCGPEVHVHREQDRVRTVRRSNKVYSLRQDASGCMDSSWTDEDHDWSPLQTEDYTTTWFGMDVRPATFTPRQGPRVCLLPMDSLRRNTDVESPVIAIWGGRSAPSHPFGDLILYEPQNDPAHRFRQPVSVCGDCPSPRWGHTLTALSGESGLMAILIGGRDAKGSSQDNVYILRLVEDGSKRVFLWSRVESSIPPQFHHTVTRLDGDVVIVFRGLSDPNNLTECMSDLKLPRSLFTSNAPIEAFQVTLGALHEIPLTHIDGFPHCFGAGSCFFRYHGEVIIPFVGGVPLSDGTEYQAAMTWLTFDGSTIVKYGRLQGDQETNHIDFASMVHSCCVSLPKSSQLFILGGGVSSFAFGESFAESYKIILEDANVVSTSSRLPDRTIVLDPPRDSSQVENDRTAKACESLTPVFHVKNHNAKALRTALESESLLDKRFRMGKASTISPSISINNITTTYIAVPVKEDAYRWLLSGKQPSPHWAHLVVSFGLEPMLLSSSTIGSQKQRSKQF